MRCPQCMQDNADGAKFCSQCGGALPQPASAATPAVQQSVTAPALEAYTPPLVAEAATIPSPTAAPVAATATPFQAEIPPAPRPQPAQPSFTPPPVTASVSTPPPAASSTPHVGVVLNCVSGPDKGKHLIIGAQEVILGCGPECGLLSEDSDVAPAAVGFMLNAAGVAFFHILSDKPVYVEGIRTDTGPLAAGQQMRIGRSFWQVGEASVHHNHTHPGFDPSHLGRDVFDQLNVRVGAVTGVGAIDGFHPKEMFSSLRHKHTEEEIEEYFITGTRTTTPTLAQIKAEWPHPWVFFKVFLSLILAYVVIAAGVIFFNNEKFIPALMIVGSFVIPISVLLFYYEMNITRNVSIYQIAKMVLLGGVISLIVSLFGYQWLGNLPIGGFLAGIVEEVGKVSALILVVRNMRYPWTLNGLLLGGAVGAGFAGIESAGYAFDALFGSNGQIDTGGVLMSILERGILAPGGHVAWAAMNGAALWRVKGNRPFEFSMLHDFRFLRVFLLTVVLHGLWDSSLIPGAGALLQYAVLTVVALVGVLGFVQDGIKQVQTAQQATVGQVGAAVSAATA